LQGLWNPDPVERLEAAISPGVRKLISQTEAHDPYTAGHTRRVAILAAQLGVVMGLNPEQLRALAQGGIVHDIGKLQVPAEVLNKPLKLEDHEFELIQVHPVNGWRFCKAMGFMPEELAIIRHHHERWDGAGYPDKLAGEAIPLLARIMAVADVYDALTSKRSYRQPWSHEQASQYIVAHKGSQFCPRVVEAWETMLKQSAQAETFALRESQIRLPEVAVSRS
jgi:HD-GYP domain-containing protein (c-di-GMP phosphodiesterase class II)